MGAQLQQPIAGQGLEDVGAVQGLDVRCG